MDVRPVTRTGVVANDQLAPGVLSWATVEELVNKNSSNARAVTQVANELYTSTRKGIRKWSLADGSSEAVVEAESFSSMVHALLVVDRDLWACLGDGHIAIYDLQSRFPKRKPFRGHNGEILCVTQGIPTKTVITGGADFQVKVWTREGELLSASGHHHGAVECILAVPHPTPTVYTGSADGSVFRFRPNASDGKLEEGSGVQLKAESQAGVSCLQEINGELWCGCENGEVIVWSGGAIKIRTKPHASRIATAAKVGSQVWTGSADRQICILDATTGEVASQLGDQGSFVKFIGTVGWHVWTVNNKGIRIFASESRWRQDIEKLEGEKKDLLAQAEASRDSVQKLADESQKRLLQVEGKLKETLGVNMELNAKIEHLNVVHDQLRSTQQEKLALEAGAIQIRNDFEKHLQEELARASQAEAGYRQNQECLTNELQQQREALEDALQEAAELREKVAASHQQSSEKLKILTQEVEKTIVEKREAETAAQSLKEQFLDIQQRRGVELGQMHDDIENFKNLLQASESEKAAATEDAYKLKQILKARNNELERLHIDLSEARSQAQQVEQERNAQIGALARDNEVLNESLQQHSVQMDNLKKDSSSRDTEYRQLQDELNRVQGQLADKVEEHEEVKSHFKALEDQKTKEAQALAKEKQDLQTQVTHLQTLKDDLEKASAEDKEKYQKGHESLKAQNDAAEKKAKASSQAILQVESQLSAAKGEQEKIRGERDKALEDLNKAHLEARHVQRNAELREKDNAKMEEELRKAKECRDDALAQLKAMEDQNLRRESKESSSKEGDELRERLEQLKLAKDKSEAILKEKEKKIHELESQAAHWEEKATRVGVDAGEAAIREKELLLEVERLRTRCRDGDVRTAALLQELHRFQQELMLHQDKSHTAKEEVESAKELAEACRKSSSAAEAAIEKLRSRHEVKIENLEKKLEEANARNAAASKIETERAQERARLAAEKQEQQRQMDACQETNTRLQHQVRVLEGEIARQSGVIQETRAGLERQEQGFYQESRRLAEAVPRLQRENEALKRENMQLQVEMHSYEHRLSHAPAPEVAHRLQEVEVALKKAISDYHMVLEELAKIREETVWKDQKIRELEASSCQLASELDYFKCEHHRVDALVGVMESRANWLRQGEHQEAKKDGTAAQHVDARGNLEQQRMRDKERWIPPTGLG